MKRIFRFLRTVRTLAFNLRKTGKLRPYRCPPPSADQIEAILKSLRKNRNN